MMYMDSHWTQALAFRILLKYAFSPQPRSTRVSHWLPHSSSAQTRGSWLVSQRMEGVATPHTLSSTSAKTTAPPHNRLQQQQSPFQAMLSSSGYFCTTYPHSNPAPSSKEWIHLASSAHRQHRTDHTYSLGPCSGSYCKMLLSFYCGLSPQLRNKNFPTLETRDQHTTNYQNISEVCVVCEQKNENTESFFLRQTSCKGLSSFTNSRVYKRGHLNIKRNWVAGKAMVRHIKYGLY